MIGLAPKCPHCEARLQVIDALCVAVAQVHRTCKVCRTRWRILVKPLPTKAAGIAMHELTYVAVGNFAPREVKMADIDKDTERARLRARYEDKEI